MFAHDELVFPS